jgi:predicted nucleic acid-binding protein
VRQKLTQGWRAVVPVLWHLEIANGFTSAERRKMLASFDVAAALSRIEKLTSSAIETDSRLISIAVALNTARRYKLSAYDGVYLDLALREGVPLASLDEQLRAAARNAGIDLLH